jgi:hypothetical protein
MATNNEAQFDSLDDLFAASLDDIADLASFATPPKGAYIATVSTDTKEINGKGAVEAAFTIIETVELEEPETDTIPAPGTKFSIAFILGNNIAEGKLKQFIAPFAEHFEDTGPGCIGRLVREEIKEITIAFTMKHRKDKEDKDKVYPDIRNISIM